MSFDDTNEWLTPMEMAERCGVSAETLRYYEREGLLDRVARGEGNHRRYSADDVAWVGVLRCLRVTAMPIREMKRFAELVRLGDAGVADRVELLEAHRVEVLAKRAALDDALQMIDHKIDVYRRSLAGPPTADTAGRSTTPTLGGRGVRSRP